MTNRIKLTAKKRQEFLGLLALGWSVSKACRAIKISRRCAYDHRRDDLEFAADWESAWEEGGDYIEDEMLRRAVEGTKRQQYDREGNLVSEHREYSDTLLIFALKGRKPEKYKDRVQAEHSGKDGGPIKIHTIVVEKPGDE